MKLFPFWECATEAHKHAQAGRNVYQQFNCAKCGTKQTMETANSFHKLGICEECGHETNIEKDGCNYMLTFGVKP
jgi:hypothetical protein